MKLLADIHISPRTVKFLRSLGHDVTRVNEILPPTAPDEEIIARALAEEIPGESCGLQGMDQASAD